MTELEKAVYNWGRLGLKDWQSALDKLGEDEFIKLVTKLMNIHLQLKG